MAGHYSNHKDCSAKYGPVQLVIVWQAAAGGVQMHQAQAEACSRLYIGIPTPWGLADVLKECFYLQRALWHATDSCLTNV